MYWFTFFINNLIGLKFSYFYCLQSHCQTKDDDSVHHVEFASGNVQLITTKESWNQTLEQARGDGKIVIFTAYLT